jgi:hypothetical protein
MSFDSQPVKPENLSGEAFDIQGFKNLLTDLKESKKQQENKAKPTYETQE